MTLSAALRPADLGVAAATTSVLSVEHVRRVAATLDDPRAFTPGADLPPLWHWAFFTPEAPTAALGDDGHPRLPVDGPMADLPRRMWAGGAVRWKQPLRVGEPAERRTHVGAVDEKSGRSGRLLIVTLHHQYRQDDEVCIDEEQNLVYREPPAPSAPPPPAAEPAAGADPIVGALVVRHEVSEPLLQRYSAVTFNAHRIHYDRPYATAVEGYPGLVVHGPLLATYLAAAAATYAGDAALESITYRGTAPATEPGVVTIVIDPAEGEPPPQQFTGRALRADATVAMHATFGRRLDADADLPPSPPPHPEEP